MTLSSTASRAAYAGNGSNTAFAVPFLFADNGHIVATLRSADGVETAWSETTDYTLSGAGDPAGGALAAATAPAAGETLVIRRVVPLTQETDYVENDPFPAETHEEALDLAAMRDQQLQEQLDRTLRFPITDTSPLPELPSFSSRASKLLGFDSQGDPTLFTPASADADTATPAGASAARALAERFADFYSVKDFGAAGDGVADDTAAIRAAFAASPQVYFPSGVYKISGEIDLTARCGLWIVGAGFVANPEAPGGFEGSKPATILQTAADTPILRIAKWGNRIDGLALIYQTQQTAAQTNAVALQLNNVSASDIRNLRIMGANTSVGIPQIAGPGSAHNVLWNSLLANIDSNSASLCHYDLRNFDGGGTNTRLDKLYANGGGALDFSSLGQDCAYVLRGRNWSGYEVDAMSIDGLTFTEKLIEIENASAVTFSTLRYESVNCRKNNRGWFEIVGGNAQVRIGILKIYRCRALAADVTTGTYLFHTPSTKCYLNVGCIHLSSSCDFPLEKVNRALSVGSTGDAEYRFGIIDAECANFSVDAWSENSTAYPFTSVRDYNGRSVSAIFKAGANTNTSKLVYATALPSSGTWSVGDRCIIVNPGDYGRPTEYLCQVAGTPGSWSAVNFSGGGDSIATQGDVDITLTPGISRPINRFAVALTANRTVTLSSIGAWNGASFKIVRPAAGAFTLDVAGLKLLAVNEWCELTYDGAWRLTGYGFL
jgi:hypothetical protein